VGVEPGHVDALAAVELALPVLEAGLPPPRPRGWHGPYDVGLWFLGRYSSRLIDPWRTGLREEALRRRAQKGPHSPLVRVLGWVVVAVLALPLPAYVVVVTVEELPNSLVFWLAVIALITLFGWIRRKNEAASSRATLETGPGASGRARTLAPSAPSEEDRFDRAASEAWQQLAVARGFSPPHARGAHAIGARANPVQLLCLRR
jgi:hypothetical protein